MTVLTLASRKNPPAENEFTATGIIGIRALNILSSMLYF